MGRQSYAARPLSTPCRRIDDRLPRLRVLARVQPFQGALCQWGDVRPADAKPFGKARVNRRDRCAGRPVRISDVVFSLTSSKAPPRVEADQSRRGRKLVVLGGADALRRVAANWMMP